MTIDLFSVSHLKGVDRGSFVEALHGEHPRSRALLSSLPPPTRGRVVGVEWVAWGGSRGLSVVFPFHERRGSMVLVERELGAEVLASLWEELTAGATAFAARVVGVRAVEVRLTERGLHTLEWEEGTEGDGRGKAP